MKTEIKIWSAIGNTPVTKRGGGYCDLLVDVTVECDSPTFARAKVQELLCSTPGADYGHFNMPGWWNQNMRSQFMHKDVLTR